MMKWKSLLLPTLLLLPPTLHAQSADEIIRRAEDKIKGKTSEGTFTMTIETPDYTRSLEMQSWWVENNKALIVIKAPPREAGNKTLKVGNELWMYLRNTETTIKVPPSMMLQSWNGSDFTNDDLVRESNLARDYNASKEGEEPVDNVTCWKIRLTPKPTAPVVWGSIVYWVRKTDGLPARVQYYDENGQLIRTMGFSEFRTMGGRKLPARWTMISNTKKNHRTIFEMKNVRFDVPISDRIFSFRELERGN